VQQPDGSVKPQPGLYVELAAQVVCKRQGEPGPEDKDITEDDLKASGWNESLAKYYSAT
jgi:hypothetical protein